MIAGRIVIPVPYDLTPLGKRTARTVQTARGGSQLRWYVSGRLYRQLPPTAANAAITREWIANAGAADNRPQPFHAFT